ncbi:MAG: response regulator [Myxococcales bacterium]|nr:response regulator [Myxococcales bacterium]
MATSDVSRTVLDNLLEGCQVISPEFVYLYVNHAAAAHGRSTPEALVGKTMMQAYPGIDQTEMFGVLRRCMRERVPASMENEFVHLDGSVGWFELRFEPVPDGVAILSVDITDRKHGETQLRRTMRALQITSRCSQLAAHATTKPELARDVCQLLVGDGGFAAVELRVEGEQPIVERAGEPPSDGATLALPIRGATNDEALGELVLHAGQSNAFDDDERRVLEEVVSDIAFGVQILRERRTRLLAEEAQRLAERRAAAAERLEAIGRLAGGVAHDFNNLLTVVLSSASLARLQLGDNSTLEEDLDAIEKAGQRAAALTQQLVAFSRTQRFELRDIDFNSIVVALQPLLERTLGDDVRLSVDIGDDLGFVRADRTQLEQVLLNLVVNARDAMPHGGAVTIETQSVTLDASYAEQHESIDPGRYVLLSVSDNGEGMTAETRQHIFEPFFSTKGPGQTSGLGLATVYGIVKQSGGTIWCYSEPGFGTTMKIYLPRVDGQQEVFEQRPASAVAAGGETILLVEDDEHVRRVAERILRDTGYSVHSAANADAALALAESQLLAIDLLLTDVIMPGASGPELARKLAAKVANLTVLFTSGYSHLVAQRRGMLEPGVNYLGKPYSVRDLTAKVRAVLDARTLAL